MTAGTFRCHDCDVPVDTWDQFRDHADAGHAVMRAGGWR